MTSQVRVVAAAVCILALSIGVFVAYAQQAASQPAVPAGELKVLKTIAAGGEARWDFVTVDPAAQRVYVAHSTCVTVFDADKGTVIGDVADTPGAHGVAIVADRNEGYVTCGKDGTIRVFDLKTLKATRTIKAGPKPDAILYDPAGKRVYAFDNKTGDITIVDPATPEAAPATLAVGGKLEVAVLDDKGHLYVNVEDKSEVVAIDLKDRKVMARWPLAPGEEPTGLAIDTATRRLFSGCANKKMIVLDADSGKVVADLPAGTGIDGAAFDAGLKLAVTANGKDGTLTVVREQAVVQTLPTAKGARTVVNDPTTHRFYLPANIPGADGKPGLGLVIVGPAK